MYPQNYYGQWRGLSGLGDASVYVTWSAVAHISGLADDWATTQNKFGNILAQRGFQNPTVSYETASWFPAVVYRLVIRGLAPQGLDGAEAIIADAAEQAGFTVDRDSIAFHAGGTPSPGDGSNPDDKKPDDHSGLYIAGAIALAALLILRD